MRDGSPALSEGESSFRTQLVGGWAGRTHALHPVACPGDVAGLRRAAQEAWSQSRSVIAKGSACSYADQVTNRGGAIIDCTRLAGIRSWDKETGRMVAWAGTTLADILRVALPAGWTIPGVPGSFMVTVGGAIANNVHGKDAHRWSFGSAVRRFDMLDASADIRSIDPQSDAATFHAVIGGLGLLGIVVSAELQLLRVPSAWVEVETVRTASLGETLEVFERRKDRDFALAWVDGLAGGDRRGRAVISLARRADRATAVTDSRIGRALTVNERVFGIVPNGWIWRAGAPMLRPPGLRLTNAVYYAAAARGGRRVVPFPDFYFLYNRINGLDEAFRPHGFAEIQALLPPATSIDVYRALLDILHREGAPPIFTAMKGHVADPFLLAFPGPGQSFTVGIPKPGGDRSGFRAVLAKVFELVIDAGGRVNLSKDEFLSADQFRRMYRDAAVAFLELKRRLDPGQRFQNDQFRRLFVEAA
jgi:decaprenylphospho-beta-D-ribofuranose 2-oxidase